MKKVILEKDWYCKLVDLIELESKECPEEKSCYMNHILAFVEKRQERNISRAIDETLKHGQYMSKKKLIKLIEKKL